MFQIKMFKCIVQVIVILLTLAKCYEAARVSVQEGEMAQLEFIYPCNSTEVTLQHSNAAPFYTSANPDVILEWNKLVTNQKGNDTCSLNLTINPVSRHDEGTYVPIAYENGHIINPNTDPRIWLHVKIPLGKASCDVHRDYIKDEWIRMYCTALKDDFQGQILCYQNGMRLPALNSPQETPTTVDQIILVQLNTANPVFCCFSTLPKTLDICECADWGWDPGLDISLSNIDPCAAASTSHSLTSSEDNTVNYTTDIPTSLPLKATNHAPLQRRDFKWHFIITLIFCGSLILIFTIFKIRKQMYRLNLSTQIKQKKRDADSGDYQVVHDKPQEEQV